MHHRLQLRKTTHYLGIMDFNKPIWRGSKSGEAESYILEGQKGSRRSANTSNHYTLILDEQLKNIKIIL